MDHDPIPTNPTADTAKRPVGRILRRAVGFAIVAAVALPAVQMAIPAPRAYAASSCGCTNGLCNSQD